MLWGGRGGVPGVCVFVCRVTKPSPTTINGIEESWETAVEGEEEPREG
jgi:hypothetical protein